MGMVYFLIVVAAGVGAIMWIMNRSKSKTDLAMKQRPRRARKSAAERLTQPPDSILSHKEELWKTRRKKATKGVDAPKTFVPKFEAEQETMYDGYSRRHRHHLTPQERIKNPSTLAKADDFSMSTIEFKPESETTTAETKH